MIICSIVLIQASLKSLSATPIPSVLTLSQFVTRRKKKCERYGEEDDDDDEDCACEHVKKEKIETFKSDHIGDQSLGGTSQEGSHQMAGDNNHTGVNGSSDGTLTSKDTMQGLVSLAT